MKFTNRQILEIHAVLTQLSTTKVNTILKFKIALNLSKLTQTVDALKKARDATDIPGAVEFFNRREIIQKVKNAEAMDLLLEEYADTNAMLKEKEREYLALLADSIDIDVLKLPLSLFPSEVEIDLLPLLPLIEEDQDAQN